MHAQEQNHAVHYRTCSLWCDSPSLQQTKEPSVLSSSFKLDRSHLKHMQLWRDIKSTFCVPYVLGVLASLVMDPLGKLTTATNQETYCNCPPRLAQLPHDHWRNTNKSKPQTQRIPMENRSLIALCREVSHGKCTPKPQNERRFVRATSFLKLWIRWPHFFFCFSNFPDIPKKSWALHTACALLNFDLGPVRKGHTHRSNRQDKHLSRNYDWLLNCCLPP